MNAPSERKPTFRIAVGRSVHISGWPAIVLTPVILPIALLVLLFGRLFGLKSSADLTPRDVETYLQDFLDGRGGDWDWDDFTSIPIANPVLDAIRKHAMEVDLPLDHTGRATLKQLLEEVRRM